MAAPETGGHQTPDGHLTVVYCAAAAAAAVPVRARGAMQLGARIPRNELILWGETHVRAHRTAVEAVCK